MAMYSELAILEVLATNIWLLILESLVSSRCLRLLSSMQSFMLLEQEADSLEAMLANFSNVISLFSCTSCFCGMLSTKTQSFSPARYPRRTQDLYSSPKRVVLRASAALSSKNSMRAARMRESSVKQSDLFSLTRMRSSVTTEQRRARKFCGSSRKYSCSCFQNRIILRFPQMIWSSLLHTKFTFRPADSEYLLLSARASLVASCSIWKAVTLVVSSMRKKQAKTTAFSRLLEAQRASISTLPFSLPMRPCLALMSMGLSDTVLESSRAQVFRHLRSSPSMSVLNCWFRNSSFRWPRASCWQKMRKLRTQ